MPVPKRSPTTRLASAIKPALGLLRIIGEPITDGGGLGMMRLGFKDFLVMGPGFGGLMQLLGAKVAQGEVSAGFIGVNGEELFEFIGGIEEVIGLLEHERKIVAGIE